LVWLLIILKTIRKPSKSDKESNQKGNRNLYDFPAIQISVSFLMDM